MPTKAHKKLQQAIDKLVISDVYLKESQSLCVDGFDPKFTDVADLLVQRMHILQKSELVKVDDGSELLRIFIRMGVRWVTPEENVDEPDIKAFIEGDFIAEYQIKDTLDQGCIDEFASKNASYHVWPYWREFLSTQCERMRLPRVVLPIVQFSKPPEVD